MPRTYASEFPEFAASDIPSELLDATQWQDMSWHNETSPRFVSVATVMAYGVKCAVTIWVDQPLREDREDTSFPRFTVSLRTTDGDEAMQAPLNSEDWMVTHAQAVAILTANGGAR
jgi:hypothetical protein